MSLITAWIDLLVLCVICLPLQLFAEISQGASPIGASIETSHDAWLHMPGNKKYQITYRTCACRELSLAVALVKKVSSMFSRRDAMRRYMDQVCAMADAAGEDCETLDVH